MDRLNSLHKLHERKSIKQNEVKHEGVGDDNIWGKRFKICFPHFSLICNFRQLDNFTTVTENLRLACTKI